MQDMDDGPQMGAADDSLVRRDQLPLPSRYVEPRTSTEARLAAIWASALTMDRVGMDDRYFDLGGDSFLATVIFTMIAEEFAIDIPMAILAETPTIASLAPRIDTLIVK
jgi:acyl carrier protein